MASNASEFSLQVNTRRRPGPELVKGTERFQPFPRSNVAPRIGQAFGTAPARCGSDTGLMPGADERLQEFERRPGTMAS